MAGDPRLLISIHHFAVLAHRDLLVEFVAFAHRVADERRPCSVFQAEPAETFGRTEQHVLERTGLRLEIPFLHLRRAAALDTCTKRNRLALTWLHCSLQLIGCLQP